jgi:hypothetical protein
MLILTLPLSAHHAFAAEYDEKKVVYVSGSVSNFKWTNPHAWLYVDIQDPNGRVTEWGFEMGAPGGLISRGWKKLELKKGDRVTVEAFASKKQPNIANAKTVTMPDGRKLFGGFRETPGNPFQEKGK